MGHFCYNGTNGKELAKAMIAEKPNDWHSRNGLELGISRGDAKSFGYSVIYGAQPKKFTETLKVSMERAQELFNGFWDNNPALSELKTTLKKEWEQSGKNYITGIDGRRIMIRSEHSILNFLFQSTGAIFAKYVTIFLFEDLEKQGYLTSPFKGKPDIGEMISYHDELELYVNPKLIKFKLFKSEDEAKEFVKNWKELEPLSEIGHVNNNWYVSLPNVITKAIDKAIKRTEQLLKLNVPFQYGWIVGRNWAECH